MKIYNGGSDIDTELNVFTGNTLPDEYVLSTLNQMFISYTKYGDGAPGKGFSASFKGYDLCDNALENEMLSAFASWPHGTYCHWLISTQDNDGYVILEFQNFNVRNTILKKIIYSL